jgi:hypothetical protein
MQWEYLTRGWTFAGPGRDDWPGLAGYSAGLERQEDERATSGGFASLALPFNRDRLQGEQGDNLERDYTDWRTQAELDYLNEIGAAGFELVSVSREVRRTDFSYYPVIRAYAYFKRAAQPGAPEPPRRRIGFQAPDGG